METWGSVCLDITNFQLWLAYSYILFFNRNSLVLCQLPVQHHVCFLARLASCFQRFYPRHGEFLFHFFLQTFLCCKQFYCVYYYQQVCVTYFFLLSLFIAVIGSSQLVCRLIFFYYYCGCYWTLTNNSSKTVTHSSKRMSEGECSSSAIWCSCRKHRGQVCCDKWPWPLSWHLIG